jgi:hypothetical protein
MQINQSLRVGPRREKLRTTKGKEFYYAMKRDFPQIKRESNDANVISR